MLLALPCAGCDSGSMKVYFNFRRQTFCYQIWYFYVAFQTGPPTRSLSNSGLLSEKYCSTIADLPQR